MHSRNIAVLVANSGHARLLRRDHDNGALKTCIDVADGDAVHAVNSRGDTEDERLRRQRVGAYIKVIAERLREAHAGQTFEGIVVVAPPRMLADLSAAVGHISPVLASLSKDLGKVPDHDLASHLERALFEADAAAG